MTKFLANLLMVFSLALCVLITFQWVREARLRTRIQALTDTIHNKSENTRALESTIKKSGAEVVRLDALKTELTGTVKSNRLEIGRLGLELERANKEMEKQHNQIDNYKTALETANKNINRQNEDIKKQNEDLKKLVEERNATVEKFNKLAGEYNELVNKWNRQQEATNKTQPSPSPKK